jgi:septal ring factor EnvC (AmiA/AmiB activator)
MGEVLGPIDGVAIKVSQTEDVVAWCVVPLEQRETKDRTSRVESDVAALRAVMAAGSAKVEEVLREVAGLTVQLSGYCSKGSQNLTNPEQELSNLKEEMRAMKANVTKAAKDIDVAEQRWAVARQMWAREGETGGRREAIAPSRGKLKEDFVNMEL